jgi:hypothetical protein
MLIPIIIAVYVLGLVATIFLTAGIDKPKTKVGFLIWSVIYVFWPIAWVIFIILCATGKIFQK